MKKLIQDQISERTFLLTGARTHESIILINARPLLQRRNFSKYLQFTFSQPKTEDLAHQDEDVKSERVFIL